MPSKGSRSNDDIKSASPSFLPFPFNLLLLSTFYFGPVKHFFCFLLFILFHACVPQFILHHLVSSVSRLCTEDEVTQSFQTYKVACNQHTVVRARPDSSELVSSYSTESTTDLNFGDRSLAFRVLLWQHLLFPFFPVCVIIHPCDSNNKVFHSTCIT